MPSYRETIEYLYALAPPVIKPGLGRTVKLLSFCSNPHLDFPSVIVAGTNGKGSTSAMLASILKEAGYKTGLYTSPHLVRFNERIRVNGKEITNAVIARKAKRLRRVAAKNGLKPSFFEFTTVMALEHFRDEGVDLAVLEAGMGGRLDSTNAVTPLVSVITDVGYDHQMYLGSSLEDIAFEKAGIIKDGGKAVIGVERKIPLIVIKKRVKEESASAYFINKDFKITCRRGGRLTYFSGGRAIEGIKVGLKGPCQLKNAACALKAAEALKECGFKINSACIRRGLKKVFWPGRIEVLRKNPSVVLDCAHNPDGASALKQALKEFKYRRLILVLGIMADKDIKGIMSNLLPLAHTVVFTSPENKRSTKTSVLLRNAKGYKCRVLTSERVSEAVKAALKEASKKDLVCVTGSVFTVGEARRYLLRKG